MIRQQVCRGRMAAVSRWHGRRRAGFTLIELLVAVAIIIIILSIIIVAVNAAGKTAQRTRTAALMDSISKGLVQFKSEIGYYPPMLGPGVTALRDLFPPPDPNAATYVDLIQDWWSSCTLAEYMIGYGNHKQDGYGIVQPPPNPLTDWDQETPPTGIRHPGDDGVWGATRYGTREGLLAHRMLYGTAAGGTEVNPIAADQGKVYKPFIELEDERLLAGVYYNNGVLETYFPGDQVPAGQTFEGMPKAIVDYWGNPIRYYRRPYPSGALDQSYRAVDTDGDGQTDRVPTLSDVFVLRPWSIKPGSETEGLPDDAGNKLTSRELDTAEFALLSIGPDKALNDEVTVDEEELNKDNIVEIGP